MLTKITINRRKDVSVATKPTHDLVASDEKYENKTIVGSLWTRVNPDGNKFLSGTIQQPREHEGKKYDGYVIITQSEYNRLTSKSSEVVPTGYTGEVNSSELDF